MDTSFSYTVRVFACDMCGGAVEAAIVGGSFNCRYCNAMNHLGLRDEGMLVPPRPPVPEHERIARLRMQDGRPLLPPPSLAQLLPGGRLEEWKVQEAVGVWNGTRKELRAAPGNYDAAERLTFLTMVLSQHFNVKGEKLRQRSMLESALEAVTLPRHRQILRGYLARAAVRSGDLDAAEAWLAPCDARSDDLQMDSAYRFSRAFIDTARGNFPRVLEVLGPGPRDVPIEDAADDVCAVFRANAWEKMGRIDQSVALLRERLQAGGGSGRQVVQQVVELYADWGLCRASYGHAMAGHAQVASRVAAQRASGGIHVVFIPLGILQLLGGLLALALTIVSAADVVVIINHSALAGVGFTGATFVLTGALFLGIGKAMKAKAERAAWLRVNGISATATIQNIEHTGLTINNVPQLRYVLLVQIPGQPPYQASATALGRIAAHGGSVNVRVDPRNRSELMIETD